MDGSRKGWYFSGMTAAPAIPVFALFGESAGFPDVVHCERIRDRARRHDWVISPHRHRDMAQFLFMRQGAAEVRLDDRVDRLEDGGFVYVAARAVHGFAFRRGSEGLVLSFPLPVLAGLEAGSAELAGRLSQPFTGRADARLALLLDQFAIGFAEPGAYRTGLLVGLAQAILAAAAECAGPGEGPAPPPADRRLRELDALLARHRAEGWRAGDYARALAVTPGHLNRLCRAGAGMSASHYIEAATIAEACRLLAFTQLSVAEVGYRLGFEDPAYFSRRFRARAGRTPSAYRQPFMA